MPGPLVVSERYLMNLREKLLLIGLCVVSNETLYTFLVFYGIGTKLFWVNSYCVEIVEKVRLRKALSVVCLLFSA